MNAYDTFPSKGLFGDALEEFIAFRGEVQVDWDAKRPEIAAHAAPLKAPSRADDLSDPAYCGWDDIAPIPSDEHPSWSVFGVSPTQEEEKPQIRGGKKLTKEQRQKLKDEEQLREARESIRKRGWSENEVKWRSWLARRGRDVMVNDWNLSQYIDGECIPPSRDPFWLNANEKPLPDYEAGNDGENEEPEPVLTNLMGEVIAPKHAQVTKQRRLKPLWSDVDGDALVTHTLGRKTEDYCWTQSTTQVHLELRVPEGTSARDCFVTMHPTRLCVRIGRGAPPILDEELFMRIYVGSNVDDDSSLWELQDKRVLVFHLTKWHRLKAGNVRDASRTWWRQCFASETPFENSVPHNEYYNTREKR